MICTNLFTPLDSIHMFACKHIACYSCSMRWVLEKLDKVSCPCCRAPIPRDSELSALMVNAKAGDLETVKLMVKLGGKRAITARTRFGETCMSLAIKHGHYDIVRYLLRASQRRGADWNDIWSEWERPSDVPSMFRIHYENCAQLASNLYERHCDGRAVTDDYLRVWTNPEHIMFNSEVSLIAALPRK